MVSLPLLLVLCLSIVEDVTASALFGQQRPPSNGTPALAFDKRQEKAVVTKFQTIYGGGDPSRTRTANSGFDIRVDIENGAWGFCGSNNPDQCDMAGVCVDKFSCTKGCGWGNTDLLTWTCADKAAFCSTALLTLENDSRAYTYLACADKAKSENFMAFTTTPKPTTSSSPPSPTSLQTSATPTSQTASSTTPPDSTTTTNMLNAASTSSAPSPTPSPDSSNNNKNNTPMIIGAVVGCVALICICVVAVFFIRRSRNAAAAAARERDGGQDGAAYGTGAPAAWEHKTSLSAPGVLASELSGRSPPVYEAGEGAGWGREYHGAAPVELPGGGGGVGSD